MTDRQKIWLALILMGLGVLMAAGLAMISPSRPNDRAVTSLRPGSQVSDFSLTDLQGQAVRLSDFHGRVVLINAWATWCPPCKEEMPVLNAYYLKHRDAGFSILAIDAADPRDAVEAFIKNTPVDFPVLLDTHLQVMNTFGIHSYPTSVLVGRDGQVKVIRAGAYLPGVLESEVTPFLSK